MSTVLEVGDAAAIAVAPVRPPWLDQVSARWLEVLEDASLRDLSYKMETNRGGALITSPAKDAHAPSTRRKDEPMNRRSRPLARAAAFVLWIVVSLCSTVAVAQEGAKAGDDFLQAVDEQRYNDSWTLSSDYFKQAVSKTEWAKQLKQVRDPLGAVAVRSFVSATPQKDPPSAPPGDYLLVTYHTTFSSSPELRTETLALNKSPDGRYRVVGYFIR